MRTVFYVNLFSYRYTTGKEEDPLVFTGIVVYFILHAIDAGIYNIYTIYNF
jgi:hypothetical protein